MDGDLQQRGCVLPAEDTRHSAEPFLQEKRIQEQLKVIFPTGVFLQHAVSQEEGMIDDDLARGLICLNHVLAADLSAKIGLVSLPFLRLHGLIVIAYSP